MSNKCDLSGKTIHWGKSVSFSGRRTNRPWKPNVHRMTLVIDGKKQRLNVSARALRTLYKAPKLRGAKAAAAAAQS